MMDYTHTPGPWTAKFGQRYGRIVDCDGFELATLDVDRQFCDVMGNCHLIAAAPELLDCLQSMMRHIHLEDFDSGAFSQDWAQACETIARATGVQA